jgi:tripartite-type tricarboxylate transporter receptor subunit TctC
MGQDVTNMSLSAVIGPQLVKLSRRKSTKNSRSRRNPNMTARCLTTLCAVGALVLAAAVAPSPATAEVSFKGKTVTIVVPFKEGGGGDTMGRLFQPFLQRHLPGSPKVVVFNRPGGAATKGSNYFERKAKPDGLTVIIVSTSTMVSQTLGGGKAKYDVRNWRPIFVVPQDTVFYARPETGVKGKNLADDIKALRKNGMVFGAKNATSAELRALVTFEMLGIKQVKTVLGLSSGKQRKALMRGELSVNYDSASSFNKKVKKHATKGKVVPFMTLGIPQADGSVIKGGVFPNLPIAIDAYRALNNGKNPTGEVYEAWKNLATMGVSASKGLSLPSGTSDEILAAYTKAIKDTLKDKEFMTRGRKIMGAYPFSFGKDAKAIYNNAVSIKPKTKDWMKAFVMDKFGVKI